MKKLRLVNVVLIVVALVLLIRLLPLEGISGSAVWFFDLSKPECSFYDAKYGELAIDDLSRCCAEVEKQLTCERADDRISCFVAEDSWRYLLNSKAYNYCKSHGFAVKKIGR
jgi:hypothetical protein